MLLPEKQYSIIYADPAWHFRTWSDNGNGKSAVRHYNTMQLADIKSLPVARIAMPTSVLFLWATFPMMPAALEVITAWGFTYKTVGFTWVKRNKKEPSWFWGLGYWTRSNAEVCLLATRGKPKRLDASVHSVVDAKVQEHSKKPDCVRDRIVQLLGDVPRIELFARQRVEGWDAWGEEV